MCNFNFNILIFFSLKKKTLYYSFYLEFILGVLQFQLYVQPRKLNI